jgi:pseudaminic acid cytidylyltransferase
MIVAVIPARKGSKRIKKKNTLKLSGKPIIAIIIEKLINCKVFDKIIISTDCNQVKKIAQKYSNKKVEVPFVRPSHLSNDTSDTQSVIKHAINYYKNKNINFKYVCCVYPTAIFFNKNHIKTGLNKVKDNKVDFIFSAKEVSQNFFRSFFIKNKRLHMINKLNYKRRTQDLEKIFIDAGQFYLGSPKNWLKKKRIFTKKSNIVEIKNRFYTDIDNNDDWFFVKKIMKFKLNKW